MALVTIGVPVYNGAAMIGECLDCLTGQTLQDIEIVVSDNASTDDTGRIVQEYAARDPRIRYIRQAENVGLMNNFRAVFEAASAPYFIFRCHDDLSSPNYVEALYKAITEKPGAKLAAPRIETLRKDRPPRYTELPTLGHSLELLNIRDLLFQSHQAWFCGLWDKAALKPVFDKVWASYDSPWGPDHLAIYPFLISQRVALAPDAVFIQRITPKGLNAGYSKPQLRKMIELRRIFGEQCRQFRNEQNLPAAREWALAVMTWFYKGKRIFKASNVVRYALLGRW